MVRPGRYCSRHVIGCEPCSSRNEGSKCVAGAISLADIACKVIGCRLTQGTRVQHGCVLMTWRAIVSCPYCMVTRHQLLTCIFVKADDSFSSRERIAALLVTILNTWWVAVLIASIGSGDQDLGQTAGAAIGSMLVTAVLTIPFTLLFEVCSRIQCCNCEWGRFITYPLGFAHLLFAALFTGIHIAIVPAAAYTFFGSMFVSWFMLKPGGIASRVWIYGKGWNRWIGIGRKSKWFGDTASSATGLG